jgi:hypothetical protein
MSENLSRKIRKISLALVLMTVIFLTNVVSGGQALAADSYDAPIDGYVESRNPNRVDSTTEELAKSKINLPDENQGESIYERVVEKTNEQKTNSALGKTKSDSLRQ